MWRFLMENNTFGLIHSLIDWGVENCTEKIHFIRKLVIDELSEKQLLLSPKAFRGNTVELMILSFLLSKTEEEDFPSYQQLDGK